MYLILDGYNILKGLLGGAYIDHSQRAAFIAHLGSYARKKKHRIALVFDGGDFSYAVRETVHGIEVFYAGFELNADQFIKKLLKQAPHRDQVLVVSSDREVRDAAKRYGAQSLNSEAFIALLTAADEQMVVVGKAGAPLIKTAQTENTDLDELMKEATKTIYIKKEDREKLREPSGKTQSKTERQQKQLRKKL